MEAACHANLLLRRRRISARRRRCLFFHASTDPNVTRRDFTVRFLGSTLTDGRKFGSNRRGEPASGIRSTRRIDRSAAAFDSPSVSEWKTMASTLQPHLPRVTTTMSGAESLSMNKTSTCLRDFDLVGFLFLETELGFKFSYKCSITMYCGFVPHLIRFVLMIRVCNEMAWILTVLTFFFELDFLLTKVGPYLWRDGSVLPLGFI